MKPAILLIMLITLSGCANLFSDNEKYVGTWFVTYGNGRFEKISLYPNHVAIISDMKDLEHYWEVKNNEIVITYTQSGQKLAVTMLFGAVIDSDLMQSIPGQGHSWKAVWSAKKISSTPNKYIDLYEVCAVENNVEKFTCRNVGSGETCNILSHYKTTSLSLEECIAQQEPLKQFFDSVEERKAK